MNNLQFLKKSNIEIEKSSNGIISPNGKIPPILEGSRLRKGSLGDYLSGLGGMGGMNGGPNDCLLYTSPSPRDRQKSRMPSSA